MKDGNIFFDEPQFHLSFVENSNEEECQSKIDLLIQKRNELLIAMGFSIDKDGSVVPPCISVYDGILGFAVGDALGVPIEFLSRDELSKSPLCDMVGYGSHDVSAGTWSDDTSMMLATMDSICDKKTIDYYDIMYKFSEWIDDGKYAVDEQVFDIGRTTSQAIRRFKQHDIPIDCGGFDERDNGNGSLMRMLPIVYYLHFMNLSEKEEVEIINNISSLTHAHEISCLGCKIFSDYAKKLLDGFHKFDAMKYVKSCNYDAYYPGYVIDEYKRILDEDISLLSIDEINSSGYVVDTLEAVLWSTLNSSSYEESVFLAVNLGGDTDTIGALTGGLNGIIYGRDQIPDRWLSKLRNFEYLEEMSEKFSDYLAGMKKQESIESDSIDLDDMFQDEPVIIRPEAVDSSSHK